MAKEYLETQFELKDFDVSEKSQSASGFDIEVYTETGEKIIAEIKTTIPYKNTDFGANQIESIRKDFSKLKKDNIADYKFFFVTEKAAYDVLEQKYLKEFEGINLVQLSERKYNNIIRLSEFSDFQLTNALNNSKNPEKILCNAFMVAYKTEYASNNNFIVSVAYEKETNDFIISFYENKEVVEDVYSEKSEIELLDAKKIKYSAMIGDKIAVPFDKTLFSKASIHIALQSIFKSLNINIDESEPNNLPIYTKNDWHSYYEEYKPYHHQLPKTKTEEELDKEYGSGYYDNGPNPFPFNSGNPEDDYGDNSWA